MTEYLILLQIQRKRFFFGMTVAQKYASFNVFKLM